MWSLSLDISHVLPLPQSLFVYSVVIKMVALQPAQNFVAEASKNKVAAVTVKLEQQKTKSATPTLKHNEVSQGGSLL